MMEMERAASSGDPDREAKTWHAKLAETERKHDGYLDLAAEGIMGREELRESPPPWRRCAARPRGSWKPSESARSGSRGWSGTRTPC